MSNYTLTLNENDVDAINFIGYRYDWSQTLRKIGAHSGDNIIPEHKAWEFVNAVYSDTDNGLTKIPLAGRTLAEKIWSFCYHIV